MKRMLEILQLAQDQASEARAVGLMLLVNSFYTLGFLLEFLNQEHAWLSLVEASAFLVLATLAWYLHRQHRYWKEYARIVQGIIGSMAEDDEALAEHFLEQLEAHMKR